MARIICVRPCIPSFTTAITVPFIGPVKGTSAIDLKSDCSGCDLSASLFAQINPFIMSLGLPLCAAGCLTAVIGVIKSLSDALGPPPDPSKISSAVANVLTQCKCILDMALPPPVGVICQFLKFITNLLQEILAVITCLNTLLDHILTLQLRASILLADPNPTFNKVGTCLFTETEALIQILLGKFSLISAIFNSLSPVFSLVNAAIPIPELANIATAFNTFASSTAGSPSVATIKSALTTLINDLTAVITALQIASTPCP